MSYDAHPPLLAVDANGFVWRVYDKYWSMCPTNDDNSEIPKPVTYYEPQRFPFTDLVEEAVAAGQLREIDAVFDDDPSSPAFGKYVSVYFGTQGEPPINDTTVQL